MEKLFFGSIAVGVLLFAGTVSAQTGMMGGYWQTGSQTQPAQSAEINGLLQNIYKAQNIDTQAKIDCGKVTDEQFEKLGNAYMDLMLPNERQHEAMDNMMGGDGSASLRQAHINMGRSYLGCWSNYNSGPVHMPMMGGYGMMNGYGAYGNNYSSGIMGGHGFDWNMMGSLGFLGWITIILIWAMLVLGIIATIKWLRKNSH